VQKSLLILTRHLPGLRSSRAFVVWIFQVVRRECLRLARQGRYGNVSLDTVDEAAFLTGHRDKDLQIDLVSAIQSLPDLYREIVILRDFEEMTILEISERTSIPPVWGGIGMSLFVCASHFAHSFFWAVLLFGIGGLVALGGGPVCWTVGLVERRSKQKQDRQKQFWHPSDSDAKLFEEC